MRFPAPAPKASQFGKYSLKIQGNGERPAGCDATAGGGDVQPSRIPAGKNPAARNGAPPRSEEHTSELQSLMRISYAVFCLKKKINTQSINHNHKHNQHTIYTA